MTMRCGGGDGGSACEAWTSKTACGSSPTTVDFEMARADLVVALGRCDPAKGGLPGFDPVLKFRMPDNTDHAPGHQFILSFPAAAIALWASGASPFPPRGGWS